MTSSSFSTFSLVNPALLRKTPLPSASKGGESFHIQPQLLDKGYFQLRRPLDGHRKIGRVAPKGIRIQTAAPAAPTLLVTKIDWPIYFGPTSANILEITS